MDNCELVEILAKAGADVTIANKVSCWLNIHSALDYSYKCVT